VIAASLLLAVAIARFLAAETQAAWPHVDAFDHGAEPLCHLAHGPWQA